jgi:hypothetical protein
VPLFSHSTRERWPLQPLINFQNFVEDGFPHSCELASFKEILTKKNSNKWKQKMMKNTNPYYKIIFGCELNCPQIEI